MHRKLKSTEEYINEGSDGKKAPGKIRDNERGSRK